MINKLATLGSQDTQPSIKQLSVFIEEFPVIGEGGIEIILLGAGLVV